MLNKAQRFHGHTSLRPVYNKGRAVYSRTIKLLWATTSSKTPRAAVVVSKKVHKSAVVRNRIRRRLYAGLCDFFKKSGKVADIILVVNDPSVATTPSDQLQNELKAMLQGVQNPVATQKSPKK